MCRLESGRRVNIWDTDHPTRTGLTVPWLSLTDTVSHGRHLRSRLWSSCKFRDCPSPKFTTSLVTLCRVKSVEKDQQRLCKLMLETVAVCESGEKESRDWWRHGIVLGRLWPSRKLGECCSPKFTRSNYSIKSIREEPFCCFQQVIFAFESAVNTVREVGPYSFSPVLLSFHLEGNFSPRKDL